MPALEAVADEDGYIGGAMLPGALVSVGGSARRRLSERAGHRAALPARECELDAITGHIRDFLARALP
jgi:hypothetical protein